MSVISAKCSSEGMVEGYAYKFAPVILSFDYKKVSEPEKEKEQKRILDAYEKAMEELADLKKTAQEQMGDELAHIFRAHLTIVEDDSIKQEVMDYINTDSVCAEVALTTIFDTYKSMFEELEDNNYNKARVLDLDDVYRRICRCLIGVKESRLDMLPDNAIIVADELFPSNTVLMDKSKVRAFVTEKGGLTSHVSILAKSLGIPAIFGIRGVMNLIEDKDILLVQASDVSQSMLYVNPSAEERNKFEESLYSYTQYRTRINSGADLKPITEDGHEIIVSSNIGGVEEIPSVLECAANSVGLFRTEFLFMHHNKLPSEEEQFLAYKKAAESFSPGMVIVRTLDIGGDKSVPYLQLPQEENPFLGYRGIRIGLDREDLLISQLRAIIRASAFGNIKVMAPMISSLWEIKKVKEYIDQIKENFVRDGMAFNKELDLGVMIEVPSSLLLMDAIAKEVDFVSIGTNDLTQYLLATDRLNEKVSSYYKPFHPAVFRAIHMVVSAMHKEGKWAGVCGELAGMKLAIPALIGLGVDELSMSANLLQESKFIINATNYSKAQSLAQEILKLSYAENIELLLIKAQSKILSSL